MAYYGSIHVDNFECNCSINLSRIDQLNSNFIPGTSQYQYKWTVRSSMSGFNAVNPAASCANQELTSTFTDIVVGYTYPKVFYISGISDGYWDTIATPTGSCTGQRYQFVNAQLVDNAYSKGVLKYGSCGNANAGSSQIPNCTYTTAFSSNDTTNAFNARTHSLGTLSVGDMHSVPAITFENYWNFEILSAEILNPNTNQYETVDAADFPHTDYFS
jgi:hypothetical protein